MPVPADEDDGPEHASSEPASDGPPRLSSIAAPDGQRLPADATEPAITVRGSRIGRLITGVLGTATAGLAALTGCRLVGLDGSTPLAQVVSFTPYLVPVALVVAVTSGLLRRVRTAAVAALVVGALAVVVVPRGVAGDTAHVTDGVRLRVMTANLYHGGSAAALVRRVRAERPDVLSLQEVTPEALDALAASGLDELLPYQAARPHPGVAGTALYGRAPFTGVRTVDRRTRFDMARARTVHKGVTLDVVAAHPSPPVPTGGATGAWYRELGWLPSPKANDSVVTVLAGDFNATLDHSRFRDLLDTGYVDAADAAGAGLTPTWQAGWVPPVTIDHILVERGVEVAAVRVHPVGASDHRAVVADLIVPAG